MPCKRLAKFLLLLLAATVLLNLAGGVFAHLPFANSSADVEQENQAHASITLRWKRSSAASNNWINWCRPKATLPSPLQPVNQAEVQLSTGNYCSTGQARGGVGESFDTGRRHLTDDYYGGLLSSYNTKWLFSITHRGGSPAHNHTRIFVVTVGTNKPPSYGGGADARRNQSRSFQENPAPNTTVGSHVRSYSDPDRDTIYHTLAGPDNGKFTIGLTDGIIRTRGDTVYDYDKGQRTFHLTVQVSDRKDPAGNASTSIDDTASVTLSLTNYTGTETPSARRMTAGPADNAISLSWNKYVQETNKPPFTGYEIRIKRGSEFLATRGVSNINTTSYIRDGLTNGTTYIIWVEACNHEGCSGNPVGGRVHVTPSGPDIKLRLRVFLEGPLQ